MTINVSDWSEIPASNTTIDGTNIAEGCPPGNINNALRSIMAGVKTFRVTYDGLATTVGGKMPADGGTFSGTQPIYTGRGAYAHHNNSAYTSCRIFVQASGAGTPAGIASGDLVFEY